MLELMNVLGGNDGESMTIEVTPNAIEQVPGSAVEFTVDYSGVPDGLSLFWTLGGDFTQDLIESGIMDGKFTPLTPNGTIVITTQTLLSETLEALKTLTLEVRILSKTGNVVGASEGVTFEYTKHPVGQIQYNVPGTYDFVVPDQVQYITAVCVGAGGASLPGLSTAGGDGGSLRWRNRIPVVSGETLSIEVGVGGKNGTVMAEVPGGRSCILRRGQPILTAKGGGGPASDNTRITYVWVPYEDASGGRWVMPEVQPFVGGGDGGRGADGGASGPGGGGGAGGYLGAGGNGANRTTYQYYREWVSTQSGGYYKNNPGGFEGEEDSGAAGGGGHYLIAGNNSEHATPGGGVGILGRGRTGEGGRNDSPVDGGRGGSGGTDASWTGVGVFGGGGRGASSLTSPFPGAVDGGGGAVRLIWGVGRAFPNTKTGNL